MALEDLAALKSDHSHRASSGRGGVWMTLLVVAALAVAGAWFWNTRVGAVDVKVATVTATTGGAAASGAVLNASGYVTARRRATVSSKVTGKVMGSVRRGRQECTGRAGPGAA